MSIINGRIEEQFTNPGDINEKDMKQLEQQVQYKEMYQPRERLDSEIENMRMLMVKCLRKYMERK